MNLQEDSNGGYNPLRRYAQSPITQYTINLPY